MTALQIIQALSTLEAAAQAGSDLAAALAQIASNKPVTLDAVQAAIAHTDAHLAQEQQEVNDAIAGKEAK